MQVKLLHGVIKRSQILRVLRPEGVELKQACRFRGSDFRVARFRI